MELKLLTAVTLNLITSMKLESRIHASFDRFPDWKTKVGQGENFINKKVFHSSTNRPLFAADSLCFIVNEFGRVRRRGMGGSVQ